LFSYSTLTKAVAFDPFLLGDDLYISLCTTGLTSKVNYANELITAVRNTGHLTNLTPWSNILPEQLTVSQLVKNFLHCMQTDGSSSCS
jgi:hypothetical protein